MKTSIWIIAILMFLASNSGAKNYRVVPSQISNLTNILPGDSIFIIPGIYTDVEINFTAFGSESLPVILTTDLPGKVIFNGKSYLHLNGKYLIAENIYFKDPVPIQSVSPVQLKTEYSVLRNCIISGFNTSEDDTTDNKWISVYGKCNTVEKCSFYDKRNIGCLLVIWLEEGIVPNHKILNNYFYRPTILKDENGGKKNGQECLRIGTSHFSMQDAACLVSGNTFYRCDSEIEVISNKSCNNIYTGNLFLETQGALTLRHGNGTLVKGNFFIGNNRVGTAGIRVIGENHTIVCNYFENTTGINYQSAICLIQGVENSPLNRYFQVKNVKISGNIINNCSSGFMISYGEAEDQSLPVILTSITDNIIINSNNKGTAITWVDKPYSPEITFNNNHVFGADFWNFDNLKVTISSEKPKFADVQNTWKNILKYSGSQWDDSKLK